MHDQYKAEIIDPGDRASALAREICIQSFKNCEAVNIVSHASQSFRGPVGFVWKPHILKALMDYEVGRNGEIISWTMLEEVENDGAGGKPQFFTLIGASQVFRGLGSEIITMTADDFARSGRFPAVIVNQMDVKQITAKNFPLFQATMEGYGAALKDAGLVNLTGEIAIMKHSITAFSDIGGDDQFVLTWGAACIGLAHKQLLLDGSKIEAGMPIIGFWEPGYRCNGGTFLTKLILEVWGPSIRKIFENKEALRFILALTTPSKSYARTIVNLIGWNLDGSIGEPRARIYGIAHVTGGGVWSKLREILPEGVGAYLHGMPKPAEVLLRAQELSWDTGIRLTDYQAYSTFHGGCGMLLIAHPHDVETVLGAAAQDNIQAQVVGETTISREQEIVIESRFKEGEQLHFSTF